MLTNKEQLTKTIAHELGHGYFQLKHPFEMGLKQGDLKDNLMDYDQGVAFNKYEWDLMHDPGIVTGLFQSDTSGMWVVDFFIIIKKGDTYHTLAKNSNGTYTFDDLKRWNPNVDPYNLKIGQAIIISAEYYKPLIKNRDVWGAKSPKTGNGLSYTAINTEPGYTTITDYYTTIAIHHYGNTNNPTIQELQEKHQNKMNKADIGYHFAISQDGTIYEGRPITIKGSHINQGNTGVIGIVMLGDYEDEGILGDHSEFTSTMKTSLINLVKYLDMKYIIEKGLNGHKGLNCGHTECPGNMLMNFLPDLLKTSNLKQADCINHENDE